MITFIANTFLIIGSLLCLISAIGLMRYSDFMSKLHASSKASSLGIIFFVIGLILIKAQSDFTLKGLLIILFIFFTTPISSYIMGKVFLNKE